MVKVSVVIPIYNVEKYLRQCLESVIKQTLREIEIICVNDGSTDGSLGIIEEYAKQDNRIVIINKENSGYGHSMNVGFDKANGEYIGIVESDDYAESEMFEKLYNKAKEQSLDVIKSSFYFYYSQPKEKNIKHDIASNIICNRILCPREDFKAAMEMVEFFNIKPTIWSAIYRRDFIRENNIRFNQTPGASFQDASFNFKVWCCANRVKLVNDAYLHYRQDNENSSVNSRGKVFCVCDEYEEMERFLQLHPLFSDKLRLVKNRIKYDSYMWNYERLSAKYKYLFIERASFEFKEDMEQGYIQKEYFEWYKWNDLMELIADPVKYHIQKALDGYSEYRDMYLEVKKSKSYKIGRIVTFLPRKTKGAIYCMKDHGMIYTIKLLFKKIVHKCKG